MIGDIQQIRFFIINLLEKTVSSNQLQFTVVPATRTFLGLAVDI